MHARCCNRRVWPPLLVILVLAAGCRSEAPGPQSGPPRPKGPQKHPDLQQRYREAVRRLEELGAVVRVEQGVPVEVDAAASGVSSDNLAAVIELLGQLDTLRRLYLTEQPIGTSHLESLVRLPHLESLNLDSTPVDDQGLAVLARAEQLKVVTLRGTKVTAQGVAQVRKEKPELLITY